MGSQVHVQANPVACTPPPPMLAPPSAGAASSGGPSPESEALCVEAGECVHKKRYDQALDSCARAVALDPSCVKAYLRAAQCCFHLGRLREAEVHFRSAGQQAQSDGIRQACLREAERASAARHGWEVAAAVLLGTGPKQAHAVQELFSLNELCPGGLQIALSLAQSLMTLQRADDAATVLEECLKEHRQAPGEPSFVGEEAGRSRLVDILLLHGAVRSRRGGLAAAVPIWRRAEAVSLAGDPHGEQSPTPLQQLLHAVVSAEAAIKMEQWPRALADYGLALELAPRAGVGLPPILLGRAAALSQARRYREALDDLERLLRGDNTHPEARKLQAAAWVSLGNHGRALAVVEALFEAGEVPRERLEHARAAAAGAEQRRREASAGTPSSPARGALGDLQRHLQVLRLPPDATREDVRKAFHAVALRNHPDKLARCPPGWRARSEAIFARAKQAHDALLAALGT